MYIASSLAGGGGGGGGGGRSKSIPVVHSSPPVTDNSMYCKIPDTFPSTAFGKGSATPDYCPPSLAYPGPFTRAVRASFRRKKGLVFGQHGFSH